MGEERVPLTQGSTIAERYRLGRLRSTSEVCRVFEAFDELLEREVTVKTLDGPPAVLPRALRAARAASRIDAPHVMRIVDVVQGDPSFLVLERYEVEDLRPPPNRQERLALADDVLAGLAALHAGHAVHRGVSADNVLCTREGRALLTTTGIAAALRDPGLSPTPGDLDLPSSPAGLAPEQAAGRPADARSDVYSAGMLLRELLGDAAGPEVEAVLDRATAPDPAVRPSDAAELRAALHHPAPPPPPVTPPPRVTRPPRVTPPPVVRERRSRRPLVAVLMILGLAGLVLTVSQMLLPPPAGPVEQPSVATTAEPAAPAETPEPAPSADALELTAATPAEAALLGQVRDLQQLAGPERAAAAAELLGRTVTGAGNGELSRGFARGVFDSLAAEVTLDGVVAFAHRDPAAGPYADRLSAFTGLAGEERSREAADLFAEASTGALPAELRAAVTAALLPDVTLDGVISLADRYPEMAGPFMDRMRALPGMAADERGHEAATLYCDAATSGLAPEYRAAASAALLPQVTLDGLVALAERVPDVVGPDSGEFVIRLRAVGNLDGEQRAGAAADLLADVDAGAPGTDLAPPFRTMAAQVLGPLING